MDELKNELQEIEKIENEEERELKKFLEELAQQETHRNTVQRVYQDTENFVEINRQAVELTELMINQPDNFLEIYRKLNSLIEKHEELKENLLQELEELGIPEKQLRILIETDRKLENIDKDVVEKIGSRRVEQAERILGARPTIYFESKALEKFISAVRREQVENGAEVPGIFGFEKFKDGYRLKKFLQLENKNPDYSAFTLDEQVQYVIENFGNDRNIIIAHSHPVSDFSHSGTDKDLIEQANNIGVIGVPQNRNIYPIPEALENGSWLNLPSKITKNGNLLSEDEVKSNFPEVAAYNRALKKSISEGNERSWPTRL